MNKTLTAITYFFIFFPYITVGNLFASDIQPFAGFFAILYLVLNIHKVKINKVVLSLFFFSFLPLFYVIFISDDGRFIYKAIAVPYALVLYLFINATISYRVVLIAVKYSYIYIGVCILQLLSPATYVLLFDNFLRIVKITELGGIRGVSALTTEPSFTAVLLFFFLIIIHYAAHHLSLSKKMMLFLALVICIVVTKSISGLLFLSVYIGIEAVKRFNIVYLLIIFFGGSAGWLYFSDLRAVHFIYVAISDPSSIFFESSFFYRVYYFVLGFVSLVENPFGLLLPNISMMEVGNLTKEVFADSVDSRYLDKVVPSFNMPSTLGMGLMIYGVCFLLLYVIIFFPIYFNSKRPIQPKLLIFYLTAQSFSFAFPPLWILVVMMQRNMLMNKKKWVRMNAKLYRFQQEKILLGLNDFSGNVKTEVNI